MFTRVRNVFYGWWIVVAVFFISAYVSGVVVYGFTAIFEPIANEFSWKYAQVSFAASIREMETSFLAPVVGVLIDRWGPRRIIFAGAAIVGLGLLLLSRVNSLAMFYGAFIFLAAGTSTCSGIIPMAAVGNWFRKKFTLATGIAISGSAAGGLLVPLVTRIIDVYEWRMTIMILGFGAFVILLPLSLIVRHKPEQYGHLSDGEKRRDITTEPGLKEVQANEFQTGARQALKSRAFWHIALGMMCHVLVINAVLTHVMPYLSSIDIPRSVSSLVASALPLISILGRLSFGWFGDRFDKKWLSSLGFIMTGIAVLLFNFVDVTGILLLVPFLILFGIGYGGPVPMLPALLREYFGRGKFGTILGLAMGVLAIGIMAGPPLSGWVFDTFGSYEGAWFALSGIVMLGMIILLTTPRVGNTLGRG
ncbi:MFS transporter [Chloroflexota bacterium]